MRKSKFTESQIVAILGEGEAGLFAGGRGLQKAWHKQCFVLPVDEQVRGLDLIESLTIRVDELKSG